MPKVVYTSAKGLVQQAGSGIALSGNELVGQLSRVYTATTALNTSDSGAELLVSSSTGAVTVTLPTTLTNGWTATFFASSVHAHVVNGGATKMEGVVFDNTNGSTLARNAFVTGSSITLVNPKVGDFLKFSCDGAKWYVYGWCNDTPTIL